MGQPHGPSRATFRRRRLVALTILLALVAGVVVGVSYATTALAAADEVLPRQADGSEVPHGVGAGGPPTEFELANPVECVPEAVAASVQMESATVKKGAKTTFAVTVENTGSVPCLAEVGGAELVVTIYSGEDKIWDSRHCGGRGDRRILLDVGASDTTTVTWSGTRSAVDCPAKPKTAKAGTYRVYATLLAPVPEGSEEAAERITRAEETFTVE